MQKPLKVHYMETYQLTEKQYDLLDEFFSQFSRSSVKSSKGLIEAKFVEQLFNECILKRSGQIKATSADISRFVNMLDSDNEGYLSFEELINLINLSLANRSNLCARMSHFFQNEELDKSEAKEGLSFFNDFYKPSTESLRKAHQYADHDDKLAFNVHNTVTFSGIVTTNQSRVVCDLREKVDKSYFAKHASVYFRESLFV